MPESLQKTRFSLYSFGFKHQSMPNNFLREGGFIIDCRSLPNPYWVDELSEFNGKDAPVKDFFNQHDPVQFFIESTQRLLEASCLARSAKTVGENSDIAVYFGCTGGKHRSVYVAEQLNKILTDAGHICELIHLDIQKK